MKLWNVQDIADNELGLLYRKERLMKVLEPGQHFINYLKSDTRVEVFDTSKVFFDQENAKFLMRTYGDILSPYLQSYETSDVEVRLVYVDGKLSRVQGPGEFMVVWHQAAKVQVELYDTTRVVFENTKARFLLKTYPEIMDEYVQACELGDKEVGLLYKDGHLATVLEPGKFLAFWKGSVAVKVDVVDIAENYELDKANLALLTRGAVVAANRSLQDAVYYSEVPDEHAGLLYVNGKLQRFLSSGHYGFWKYNRSVQVKLVDLRVQAIEVSGQEILTKDRVSLRINLSGSYKIVDPEAAALKVNDYAGFIYRELQLRLREAVGTQTLDTLLEDKDALNQVIADDIRQQLKEYGIEFVSVGVKDIILPGDMKEILNQVVEAQKEAEANVIRRKEETQAMRSLHNTAKVMENNPVILRLKELESLERIAERIDRISVYGGLDSVMQDLVKLPAKMSNAS